MICKGTDGVNHQPRIHHILAALRADCGEKLGFKLENSGYTDPDSLFHVESRLAMIQWSGSGIKGLASQDPSSPNQEQAELNCVYININVFHPI